DDDRSSPVKSGYFHAPFRDERPFSNGNGRVGRLLITFLTTEPGALRHPLRQRDPPPERVGQGACRTRDARMLW
ncbi:MAG: hypothetical protein ACNA8R_15725, partial [Nitriliruptoraceae bacterium]